MANTSFRWAWYLGHAAKSLWSFKFLRQPWRSCVWDDIYRALDACERYPLGLIRMSRLHSVDKAQFNRAPVNKSAGDTRPSHIRPV